MNKKDIIEEISIREGFSKRDTQIIVESFLSVISECLERGEEAKINYFGTFYVGKRKARTTTDVCDSNKVINIPESYDVRFKPGKPLKKAVKKQ